MTTTDVAAALDGFFSDTWPSGSSRPPTDSHLPPAWERVTSLGLHLVGIAEATGGAGGDLGDLVAICELAGRHAIDVPLVEASLAAWTAAAAGLPLDEDRVGSVPTSAHRLSLDGDRVSGTVEGVPWGRDVDHVVVLIDDRTVRLRTADATVDRHLDLADQPRDDLVFDDAKPLDSGIGAGPDEVLARSLALRVAQVSGAVQAVAALTRRYVAEREQFGRPIGAFQAVQAHVVSLEQMAVMTTALSDRLALGPELALFDALGAKLVADENGAVVAAAAHQAHGAIGMTQEYELHLFTRRLHTWAGDFAESLDSSVRLGEALAAIPSVLESILDDHLRPEIHW